MGCGGAVHVWLVRRTCGYPSHFHGWQRDLILFGVDPVTGDPFPKPYVYVFRSPVFAPVACTGMLEPCSIGKGAGIKTYCEALRDLAADDDLIRLENLRPGGIVMGLEDLMTERLHALPISGISPHLHVCIAFRDRVTIGTNNRVYIGEPPGPISLCHPLPTTTPSSCGWLAVRAQWWRAPPREGSSLPTPSSFGSNPGSNAVRIGLSRANIVQTSQRKSLILYGQRSGSGPLESTG